MTGLTITTDKGEYSRFEAARSVIRVRVLPTPTTGLNDTVLVALRRKGGPVIATKEIAFVGAFPKGSIVEFDLKTIVDADGIPSAISGTYEIDGYSPKEGYTDPLTPGLVKATSAPFLVSMITVEEMRNGYCFGSPLYSSDTPFPKRQPVVVTGVKFYRLSESTRKGTYALVYVAATGGNPATLSWGGGAAIPIASGREILPDAKGGYAEVDIDKFDLPASDASEGIVVDKQDMQDDVIRSEIARAIAEVENVILKVWLEPQRFATSPFFEEGGYDRKTASIMFTRNDFNLNGMSWKLDIPVGQILKIDRAVGYIGNTKALEIASGAFAAIQKTGQVDVLPYNSQYTYLYTFFTMYNYWGFRDYISDFWRYSGVAGLRECPADVLKLAAFKAAVSVLTLAGQGYRGGFSSESTSKDGVSRSVSYTASAQYGIYSATIAELKDWIKENEPKLRNQYRGIAMVVL